MLIVSPGSVSRYTLDLKNLDIMDEGTKQNHKLLPAFCVEIKTYADFCEAFFLR